MLKIKQNLIPELFAIIYIICAALIVYLSRIGFENYPILFFKSIFLSIFLILSPAYFKEKFPNIFKSKILGLFTVFVLVFFSSELPKFNEINITYLFCTIGLFFFIKLKIYSLVKSKIYLVVFTIIFCTFTLAAFYHFQYKTPLFVEQIISGASAHRDTLWHATVAGMIKTYGIPSSGLDGIIPLNYHFFAHYIIAKFSILLNINTLQFYILITPIIILPLFFLSFLFSVNEMSTFLSKKYNFNLVKFDNKYFWLLFIVLFSLPYSLSLSPENTYEYINSFTYFIAFLFSFFLFGILFGQINSNKPNFFVKNNLVQYLIFPLLVLCIFYSKISFLYFINVSYLFLYLRLSLYKKYNYNILFLFLILISLYMFYNLVVPMLNEYPHNSWKKNFITILLEYKQNFFLSAIYIFFRLYFLKIKKIKFFLFMIKEKKLIDIEYLIVLGIFLLPLQYDYFHSIQVLIAIFLLCVFSENIIIFIKNLIKKKKNSSVKNKLIILLLCIFILLSFKNILLLNLKFFSSNFAIRESFFVINKVETKGTHYGAEIYWKNVIKNMKSIIFLDFSNLNKVRKKIENINIYSSNYKNEAKIIKLLKEINKLQNKNESVIYIPKEIKDYWSFSCDVYMIPFIATSITNISLVNGVPDINKKSCFGHNLEYGYFNYYKKLNFLVNEKYISPKEICNKDLGIKFKKIIEIKEKNSVFYFKDHYCK